MRTSLKALIRKRLFLRLGIAVLVLASLVFVLSYAAEGPLKRLVEARANESLTGYRVSIGRLDLHPVGFSVDLEGVTITQEANPKPPVADLKELKASIHWRKLLDGRLVADVLFSEPKVNLDLTKIAAESKDPTPAGEKGWQEALKSVYPFNINLLKVKNGSLTYSDRSGFKPLRLSSIEFEASNIRNIDAPLEEYPSMVRLSAVVFDSGRLNATGRADFLKSPHPGFKAEVDLAGMPLGYFEPLASRRNLSLRGGNLSVSGLVEFSPGREALDLQKVVLTGADADYISEPAGEPGKRKAQKVKEKAGEKAKEAAAGQGVFYRIARLEIKESSLGMVNRIKEPSYRVFVDKIDWLKT